MIERIRHLDADAGEGHVADLAFIRLGPRDFDHAGGNVDGMDVVHIGSVGKGGGAGAAAKFQQPHVRAQVAPRYIEFLAV